MIFLIRTWVKKVKQIKGRNQWKKYIKKNSGSGQETLFGYFSLVTSLDFGSFFYFPSYFHSLLFTQTVRFLVLFPDGTTDYVTFHLKLWWWCMVPKRESNKAAYLKTQNWPKKSIALSHSVTIETTISPNHHLAEGANQPLTKSHTRRKDRSWSTLILWRQ